ncbi:MAG: DNA-binding protein WhiA [Oscillospiraceae bacterium]
MEIKSFTNEVIAEINNKISLSKQNIIGYCYGMLFFGKSFNSKSISFFTKNHFKCEIYCYLIKKIFNLICWEDKIISPKADPSYLAKIMEPESKKTILSFFGYKDNFENINKSFLKKEGEINAFIAGAFIACGSITSPQKGYRVEFTIKNEKKANEFIFLLKKNELPFKLTVRNGDNVIYSNDSSVVEDLLTFIGAQNSSMEIMEVKIVKNLRNSINRKTNCEMANINKTISAAEKQINAIKKIENSKGLEFLSEDLREICYLRLENPEMSLKELGENLSKNISRSGVNHRIEKLLKIADEI